MLLPELLKEKQTISKNMKRKYKFPAKNKAL